MHEVAVSPLSLVGHRQQKLFPGGRVGRSRTLYSKAVVAAPELCTPHKSTAGINCNNCSCTALHAPVRDGCTAEPLHPMQLLGHRQTQKAIAPTGTKARTYTHEKLPMLGKGSSPSLFPQSSTWLHTNSFRQTRQKQNCLHQHVCLSQVHRRFTSVFQLSTSLALRGTRELLHTTTYRTQHCSL